MRYFFTIGAVSISQILADSELFEFGENAVVWPLVDGNESARLVVSGSKRKAPASSGHNRGLVASGSKRKVEVNG